MTLLYLFAMGIGIVFIVFPEKLAEPDENPISYTIMGVMFIAICIPFVLMYAAAPLLPKKRWAWIYGIVMIVIGLNGCPIFFSVPLLIFWLKAETKAYFGADRPT